MFLKIYRDRDAILLLPVTAVTRPDLTYYRLIDLAETSGYSSPQPSSPDSTKNEPSTSFSEEQGGSSQENLISAVVLDNLEQLSELEG